MRLLYLLIDKLFGSAMTGVLDAYKFKVEADNKVDQRLADLQMKQAEIQQSLALESIATRKDVKGFWEIRAMTFFIAFPFALHSLAVNMDSIFLFDWNVAQLPEPYDDYQGQILLWFFGIHITQTVAGTLVSAIRRR